MTAEEATVWAGIISGVIGGGLAVIGAILAVRKGVRDLEDSEIRRLRVTCITNLYGLRFVLGEGYSRVDDIAALNFELNRAGALFADVPGIQNDLRDFHAAAKEHKTDATDRLIALIKNMGQRSRLHVDQLSDTDVKNILQIPTPNLQTILIQLAPPAPPPNK